MNCRQRAKKMKSECARSDSKIRVFTALWAMKTYQKFTGEIQRIFYGKIQVRKMESTFVGLPQSLSSPNNGLVYRWFLVTVGGSHASKMRGLRAHARAIFGHLRRTITRRA